MAMLGIAAASEDSSRNRANHASMRRNQQRHVAPPARSPMMHHIAEIIGEATRHCRRSSR